MADAYPLELNRYSTPMTMRTEDWNSLPWAKLERNVFRLQKRIYKATLRGDFKTVRNLQRLLLRSYSARCLAVRRVSQDNRGKRTAGVDGIANLRPTRRIRYVQFLRQLNYNIMPLRRTYIDKRNSDEKRPLGIPTMFDRAMQALVKLVLEPEWEAKFEANSYGFRPGRSCHDAIEAIFNFVCHMPKFVLDADIEKCFDRINHDKLMTKLSTFPAIDRLIRGWLKAGILDGDELFPTKEGTPQGGVISPLLANIALHGLESDLLDSLPKRTKPGIIRYADDFVILHRDLDTLLELKQRAEEWLADMGLQLKESKTTITHTLHEHDGQCGFDFLSFNIRQFKSGQYTSRQGFRTHIRPSKDAQKRHLDEIAETIKRHRGVSQTALITTLNRKIRGWSNYFRICPSSPVFSKMRQQLYWKLRKWATWRHPNKSHSWCYQRYWHRRRNRVDFCEGNFSLTVYTDIQRQRHIKVRGTKSPFDGDWLYWASRLGREPTKPDRLCTLLKRQRGTCQQCGLHFRHDDIMEIHHIDKNHQNRSLDNLAVIHGHCHDEVHR